MKKIKVFLRDYSITNYSYTQNRKHKNSRWLTKEIEFMHQDKWIEIEKREENYLINYGNHEDHIKEYYKKQQH